ncbi:MAG: hypothetical protein HRT45_12635 [Bdellovibrionales bacterium]|nr:hypothetical protein [Bdellovibrionales bacterium]
MSVIKLILIFGLTLGHAVANAGDWVLQQSGDGYQISSKQPGVESTQEVERSSFAVKLLPSKNVTEGDFEVVVFYHSTSGTSFMIRNIRGAVFDKKNNKFLGVSPFEYQTDDDEFPQPDWAYSEDGKSLRVTDPESGLVDNYTID